MLILAKQRNILPYTIAVVAGMTVQPPFLYVMKQAEGRDKALSKADIDAIDEEAEPKLSESGAGQKKKKRKNENFQKRRRIRTQHDIRHSQSMH